MLSDQSARWLSGLILLVGIGGLILLLALTVMLRGTLRGRVSAPRRPSGSRSSRSKR